jgi:hypothetical protein
MSRLLEIQHSTISPCRIAVPALVAGFFRDERPLRGSAGLLDWRLNGYVSKLLEDERLSGDANESTLVASQGRLPSNVALFVGLGGRSLYGFNQITNVISDVTRTLQKLHIDEFALEIPGARPLSLDPAESAYNTVKGIVKILSASAPEIARMRVTLLEPESVTARLRFGLRKAQSNFQGRVQIALGAA